MSKEQTPGISLESCPAYGSVIVNKSLPPSGGSGEDEDSMQVALESCPAYESVAMKERPPTLGSSGHDNTNFFYDTVGNEDENIYEAVDQL